VSESARQMPVEVMTGLLSGLAKTRLDRMRARLRGAMP
jgi:hypothetical protein